MTVTTSSLSVGGRRAEGFEAKTDASGLHAPVMGLHASRPLSVSRVASRLAEIIDARLRDVRAIWVKGDIGDLRSDSRGTLRFTLSDGKSHIECVWWTPDPRVAAAVSEGMQVVVKGRPKVFTRAVGLVYVVAEVRPVGAGQASSVRDQTRVRLSAEGLFAPARKRSFPRVPRGVAIITGRSSAAWYDVLAIARRRHPGIPVVLVPAQMQGDAAPESICTALRVVESSRLFDVVVITRGGGGAADLTAFDDESLARAIAACSVPVVTAIGHEVDFSFADAVADCREPTPSAAAARVIPDRLELSQQVDACHVAMAAALRQRLARDMGRLVTARGTLGRSALVQIEAGRRHLDRVEIGVARGLALRLERARSTVTQMEATVRSALPRLVDAARPRLQTSRREIEQGMRRRTDHGHDRLCLATRELNHAMRACVAHQSGRHERAAAQFAALNPLAVLCRGYVVVRDAAGEMITSVSQVQPGATLSVQFHDGAITVSASEAGRVSDLTPGADS